MLSCSSRDSVQNWLTLVSGLLECLYFTGVHSGWPSLLFILKASGFYSELCMNATGVNGTQYTDCSQQDDAFSVNITIVSFVRTFLCLLTGIIFDRFGTRASRLLAIVLYTAGTLMIAFSHSEISFIVFPGLTCIGFGGIMLFLTNMQVGNLFDAHRSTVVTFYNGAYSSSAITFLLVKVAFDGGISLQHSFFFLSAYSIIHLMRTFFLLPKMHIPYPLPKGYTYGMSFRQPTSRTCCLQKTPEESIEFVEDESGIEEAPPEGGEQENPARTPQIEVSFKQCALSWLLLWHLLWNLVMALLHMLYFATLNQMLTRRAQGDLVIVNHYINVFAYVQLCGILCAPINGLIIDWCRRRQHDPGETDEERNLRSVVLSLFLTALQCLLFAICITIPVLPLQYLTFVLQVINRAFICGGNASYIGIFFPACYYGKLYGLVSVAVMFGCLLQFPCIILVNKVFNGDPLYINVALCFLCLTAFIHPAYVYIRWRRLATKRRFSAQTPTPVGNSSSGDSGDKSWAEN